MPPRPRPRRPLARAVSLCLAALLGLPPGIVRAQEVIDLMGQMEKAFVALVQQVLVLPVQNMGDPPFPEAAREAAKIAETAGQIPKTGAFPGDQAFLKLAREALEAARQAETSAKEKRMDGAVAALVKLHAACTACHKDFRF